MEGIRLEVATQSFATETRQSSTDNTLYYTEALYDGKADMLGYKLSANTMPIRIVKVSRKVSLVHKLTLLGLKRRSIMKNFWKLHCVFKG